MAHEEQDFIDGWQAYSTWIDGVRDNSSILTRYESSSSFRQQLLTCNSNMERFKLIWENKEIKDELVRSYKGDQVENGRKRQSRSLKSAAESKRLREMGNKSFKDGKFMESLRRYTQAVRLAPYPSPEVPDESLALALANRSAALYSLTRYRLCLLDIDLATKYGYPEASMFKLLIRKVKCLHILSVWANDVEQIKTDLKLMVRNRDTKDYIKSEINGMFEFIEQSQPEIMPKDELDVVDESTMKISNFSKSLTQAADCVELSFDSDKGRYLITNKDISIGRLLVAESPYVCNLAPSKREEYCYNCFGRLYSRGLGCSNCTQVLYCSEECRDAKALVHVYECNSLLDFQEKLGVAYLVAHIMFTINFDLTSIPVHTRKTVEKKSLDEVLKISLSDWPDLVYRNSYVSVLSLMDHASDFDFDALLGYSLTAAYLTIAILDQHSTKNSQLSEHETQLVMGSIILKHTLQLQTNLISVLDQDLQELVSVGRSLTSMQERPIGVGIYPTISLLNHSCTPNIISLFHRNKFVARAASSLECGTEINYCYGPSVARMSRKDRQQRLREQYFFTCNCDSCVHKLENKSRALLCPECGGPVIYNQDFTHECLDCHAEELIDVRNYLDRVSMIKSSLQDTELSDNSLDERELIKKLQGLEVSLSTLVYWCHPMFMDIKIKLYECAEGLGDMSLALKFCQEEQDLCSKTHGSESYETIMSMLKLIHVKWQKLYQDVEESKTQPEKDRAIEELKNLLTTINETRGKLKDLLASTDILGAVSSYETELKFLSSTHSAINNYLTSSGSETSNCKATTTGDC